MTYSTFRNLETGSGMWNPAFDDWSVRWEDRMKLEQGVIERNLLPAKENQVFAREGWFVWGGSVCREGNQYYIFASSWKKEYTFGGWVKYSTIIQGVGERPEGPFRFVREMTELKEQGWSREMVHNPTVLKIGELYYLYYIGTTGDPSKWNKGQTAEAEIYRYNQKIGVAVGKTLRQPLVPSACNPILEPVEKGWDCTYVTNPAVVNGPDGIRMVYKSLMKDRSAMKLGLAAGETPEGPFHRLTEKPLFEENIEDPFIWYQNRKYHMIVKDMQGSLAKRPKEAVLYTSEDGVCWNKTPEYAYGTEIAWETGNVKYSNVERPQIYLENGKPLCMYNAVGNIPEDSFNVARRFRGEA